MSDAEWRQSEQSSAAVRQQMSAAGKQAPPPPPPRRYPLIGEQSERHRGVFAWLRGEKVVVWTIALLLGHAIGRIVNALFEDVVEPAFNAAFRDPDNKRPEWTILGAKIKARHFIVAVLEFVMIIAIAYALSGSGRRDPAYLRPLDAPAR